MIEVRTLRGSEVASVLDDLARLRIEVFRTWPYLYEGSLAYERTYLSLYETSQTAIVVGAFDGDNLVGAATGTAMEDHKAEFSAPLHQAGMTAEEIFYCAESVLLPAYRGQGLGHVFFDEREAQAKALGRRWSLFCSVVRPHNHPLRPEGYRPLDPFWRKRGYAPVPGAEALFTWRDIDAESETEKRLQIWRRPL